MPAPRTPCSASRTGPAVITGEAIRTRARAPAIRSAIRSESSCPRPGQNHGRTVAAPTRTGSLSSAPLSISSPLSQSSSKTREKAAATAADRRRTMAFSSRVKSSVVQFVDPVQTASSSRTANLWCIRSRTGATVRTWTPRRCSSSSRVSGAGAPWRTCGWMSGWWTTARTAMPRAAASRRADAISLPGAPGTRTEYSARSSVRRTGRSHAARSAATEAALWPPSLSVATSSMPARQAAAAGSAASASCRSSTSWKSTPSVCTRR